MYTIHLSASGVRVVLPPVGPQLGIPDTDDASRSRAYAGRQRPTRVRVLSALALRAACESCVRADERGSLSRAPKSFQLEFESDVFDYARACGVACSMPGV